MNKPVIGITPSHNTENDDISMRPTYLRAVAAAGGIPILLPLEGTDEDWKQVVRMCDGILFSGGPDVHPFSFGEETQAHCGNVSMARDNMEMKILQCAMEAKKPILGTCRGIQIINIALGGDIYQDIPSQTESSFPIAHKQPFASNVPSHHVRVAKGSLLERMVGGREMIGVNSFHHQAVRKAAPGLVISGYAPDGLAEAVEMPGYPYLLGVQWHPECMWKTDAVSKELFVGFVGACRTRG